MLSTLLSSKINVHLTPYLSIIKLHIMLDIGIVFELVISILLEIYDGRITFYINIIKKILLKNHNFF